MTTISATSILASKHAITGDRIDTLLLRYPRWIHAEGRTHRLMKIGEGVEILVPTPSLMEDENLSRNASSSRAIPVEKLIQDVLDDPAVPLFWGANQKGMQADEECDSTVLIAEGDDDLNGEPLVMDRDEAWHAAMEDAVEWAKRFSSAGYHKQIVNRLLEPFSHITVVATATNWSNFLALRDHPDAEPHIQMLAAEIRTALDDAIVQELQPGEWHLPFVTSEDWRCFPQDLVVGGDGYSHDEAIDSLMKVSAARCASASYKTVDGFDMTIERAVALVDKLIGSTPLHASPFEHVAQADRISEIRGWREYEHHKQHGNFTGFRQWRKMLPNECQ